MSLQSLMSVLSRPSVHHWSKQPFTVRMLFSSRCSNQHLLSIRSSCSGTFCNSWQHPLRELRYSKWLRPRPRARSHTGHQEGLRSNNLLCGVERLRRLAQNRILRSEAKVPAVADRVLSTIDQMATETSLAGTQEAQMTKSISNRISYQSYCKFLKIRKIVNNKDNTMTWLIM